MNKLFRDSNDSTLKAWRVFPNVHTYCQEISVPQGTLMINLEEPE